MVGWIGTPADAISVSQTSKEPSGVVFKFPPPSSTQINRALSTALLPLRRASRSPAKSGKGSFMNFFKEKGGGRTYFRLGTVDPRVASPPPSPLSAVCRDVSPETFFLGRR